MSENRMMSAFVAKHGAHCNVSLALDGDRYWVSCLTCGAAWAVVDCESASGEEYFDFEEVSQGDHYCEEL